MKGDSSRWKKVWRERERRAGERGGGERGEAGEKKGWGEGRQRERGDSVGRGDGRRGGGRRFANNVSY